MARGETPMAAQGFRAWARERRTPFVVLGLILVVAGVDLLLNPPKGAFIELLSLPLLAAGGLILATVLWPEEAVAPALAPTTLASRLVHRLTLRGRLLPYLPLLGLLLIAVDVAYNALLVGTASYGTQDTIVLITGLFLMAHRFVPARFAAERDFLFVFLLVLNLILTAPILLFRLANLDFNRSVDAYSWALLAPETSATLNLFGVRSWVAGCDAFRGLVAVDCASVGAAPGLSFTTSSGSPVVLFITTACSGIYSFGIFTSAFAAYVCTDYNRLNRRVGAFLVLGILASYVANILRMVAIALVGYYSATPGDTLQNMLTAHSNFGWIIFLAWISLFWLLMFRFLKPASERKAETPPAKPKPRGTRCVLCGDVLTVAIPGTRCACGRFYHEPCLAAAGACPACNAPYRKADGGEAPA